MSWICINLIEGMPFFFALNEFGMIVKIFLLLWLSCTGQVNVNAAMF